MSSNLKTKPFAAGFQNGYTRQDVIRMTIKYKKERIDFLEKLISHAGGNIDVIGEPITPKLKMNLNENA